MLKLKSNRAATMSDIVIALIIIIMFIGILTTSFYSIYKYNLDIRMDAIAVYYAVNMLENIQKTSYDEVSNSMEETLAREYIGNENYTMELKVKKYNEDDSTKEDLIKIVTVTIKYKVANEDKVYTVKTLKIRE